MTNSPKSLFRGASKLATGTFAAGAGQQPNSSGSLIPHSVSTAGPTFGTATLGTPVATGNATVHQPFTVVLSDFIAGKNPAWFAGLKFYKRAHGDTHLVPVGILLPQTDSVTWTNAVDLGVGSTTWDIGLSYIAPNGSESAVTYPSALSAINPGALAIGAVGANAVGWKQLVGDSSGDTTTAIADTTLKQITYNAHATQVKAVAASTADSQGSYLQHSTVYADHLVTGTGTQEINVNSVPDGTTRAAPLVTELAGSSGSYTVKQLNDGTNVRTAAQAAATFAAATNTGLDNVLEGSTYNRVKASEVTTGFVKQLNDGTNVRNAAAVAANMNSSGQSLLVEFPGGYVGTDGALTNVDGATSTQSYPLPAGTTITVEAQIAKGGTGDARLLVGNRTNGYGFDYDGSGSLYLEKFIAGAVTVLGAISAETNDTNYHTFLLTITVVSSTSVQIQGTWDGVDPNAGAIITDTSLNLTSGTWPITLYTGGSAGKVLHLHVTTALAHWLALPASVLHAIDSGGVALPAGIDFSRAYTGKTLDNVPNGSTRGAVLNTELAGSGTVKQLNDGTNVRNAAAAAALYDASGNIKNSTTFIVSVPNAGPFVTDATISYSWSSGSAPYTVAIWFDNGTAGTDATVIFGNGTTFNLGHTTSASPSYSNSSVASGTNFYMVLHYASGTTTMTVQTTIFTVSQMATYIADGGIVAVTSSTRAPIFTPSGTGGGSGSYSGGGGAKLN